MDAQAHGRQQGQRLVAGDGAGVRQDAPGPEDPVVQGHRAFVRQHLPRLLLVGDDLRNDGPEGLQDVLLAAPQGRLVRDLVDVAGGLGALAVKAADGQAHPRDRPEHLFNLLGQRQAGQVQHDAGPHGGAHVRGAGREVPEFGREGVRDLLFQAVVDGVGLEPGLLELDAGEDDLQAQVVLFVGHDGHALGGVDGHAALALGGGEFAADEVALHEAPPVDLGHVGQLEPRDVVRAERRQDGLPQVRFEFLSLFRPEARREGPARHVSGQPHPRGQDDVALGSAGRQPRARRQDEVIEFHLLFPSPE